MSKPNHKADRLSGGAPVGGKTAATHPEIPNPTGRHSENELRTQTNRSVTAGGGVKRGDQRDTHPSYSTGKVHRNGGRSGPLGASGRRNGPKSGGAGGGSL
ncbi:MAG: hypothetical protein JWM57_432 [Phycisphaerales bacterium]|nr:hypothetical protein [Phycisphaerales bacterium]